MADQISESTLALVEQAAGDVMVLDPKKLPAMASFAKTLRTLASNLRDIAGAEAYGEQAELAADAIERIILDDSHDPAADFSLAEEAVHAIQTFCYERDNGVDSEVDGTSAPGGSTRAMASSDTEEAGANIALSSAVDEDILIAFIEQQDMVLPEIDKELLEYEADHDLQHIASLRRMIHTLKGEAGVCGLAAIERVCHRLEDYLNDVEGDIETDQLFNVKDWLAEAVEACRGRNALPSPQPIFDELLAAVQNAKQAGAASPQSKPEERQAETPAATVDVESAVPPPDEETEDSEPAIDTSVLAGIDIEDQELARDFVGEAREHFESADINLLTLEDDPTDQESVAAVFRAFHTIKGVAGFLGLDPIGTLAHRAETLLDEVRRGKREFRGATVDVTFAALDMLKEMVEDMGVAVGAGTQFFARPELPGLLQSLDKVLSGAVTESAEVAKVEAVSEPVVSPDAEASRPSLADEEDEGAQGDASGNADSSGTEADEEPEQPEASPSSSSSAPAAAKPSSGAASPSMAVASTVKIEADRLDLLIDTIGELVIAQAIVAQDPEIQEIKSEWLEKNLGHLSKITRTLQDMSMGMRMVPVEGVFQKMARLVRDLSKKSGKKVKLTMSGRDTELDRGMVDKLGDPLVHMIRNAVDHGIEPSADDRVKAGKPAEGNVHLRAFHQGGSIHIQIEDDGRGLNRDAIVTKGIERGLIKSAEGMSDSDVFALIFEAGFSTAQTVSEISGRGVGMDVVLRNIESLRGNVKISSEPGKGSVFTIVLPLTMAIIDGMVVAVGGEQYIMPTLSIIESFRPSNDQISTVSGRGEMLRFREALVPLFRISRLFGLKDEDCKIPTDGIVMVIEDGGKKAAVVVDDLLGQQQTVIKSLGHALGQVQGISGASIMPDGRPGLILDVAGIVKMATE